LSLQLYVWISLPMHDNSFRPYLCGAVIIRILVFKWDWTKFLLCIRTMFVSFYMMSLAPFQTNTVSSLLRLLISLSAIYVIVSFLAPGITVPVTSCDSPTKVAISMVQPQAWLSPITIILFFFHFTCKKCVVSVLYCCLGSASSWLTA
jgi:hypothetical protein